MSNELKLQINYFNQAKLELSNQNHDEIYKVY